MPQSQSRVRFIGSRELHRDLPKVLDTLENPNARFVLTIHSKPKAVLDRCRGVPGNLARAQPGRPSAGTSARRTRAGARIVDPLDRHRRPRGTGRGLSRSSRVAAWSLPTEYTPSRIRQDREGFLFLSKS